MSELSGRPLRAPFATYDRGLCCWRTLIESLWPENWAEPSVIWPLSGSMRNGAVYELPTREHHIDVGGSSSSPLMPTPQARDGDATSRSMSAQTAAKRFGQGKRNLDDAIALLPTPAAADSDRTSRTYARGNPTLLGAVVPVPLLPTPTATDAKSSSGWNPAWSHNMTLTDAARSIGQPTDLRSADGSTSSDDPHLTLSLWDDEADAS